MEAPSRISYQEICIKYLVSYFFSLLLMKLVAVIDDGPLFVIMPEISSWLEMLIHMGMHQLILFA